MSKVERQFRVHVYGYDPYVYQAASHGAARWKCFRAFRDATDRADFHWFLTNSRVELLLTPTTAAHGAEA